MNDTQQTQSPATSQAFAHARCACDELTEAVSELLGFSPAVKQHLHNSRIEFLKALREMIDARISHLAGQDPKVRKYPSNRPFLSLVTTASRHDTGGRRVRGTLPTPKNAPRKQRPRAVL